MNKRAVGTRYEDLAAAHLISLGYRILSRNYRCRAGEIDLIASEKGYLVFIEVKYRSDESNGSASEAVDAKKQKRIIRAARWYLMERHLPDDTPVRFDVVAFDKEETRVIKDAFWT
ncbi:MAG: YraN family protein [Lachnospiraceae bacterium]|nr:YraN family protein [Lachnospiraceae bacterium]